MFKKKKETSVQLESPVSQQKEARTPKFWSVEEIKAAITVIEDAITTGQLDTYKNYNQGYLAYIETQFTSLNYTENSNSIHDLMNNRVYPVINHKTSIKDQKTIEEEVKNEKQKELNRLKEAHKNTIECIEKLSRELGLK